jgi:hypothetical protein
VHSVAAAPVAAATATVHALQATRWSIRMGAS